MKLSPEQVEQSQCVQFTRIMCPQVLISASQNGMYLGDGKNVYAYITKQKALGMLPGELDLMLTWPGKNVLFVEMKYGDNKTTDNQNSVIAIRGKQGFDCVVARSLVEYVGFLRTYSVPMKSGFYAGIGKV